MIELTDELIAQIGLTGKLHESDSVVFNAGLEWLSSNTDLQTDTEDAVLALPASAWAFLWKYVSLIGQSGRVIASESIGGLSRSYQSEDLTAALGKLAEQLLPGHFKGGVRSVSDYSRWI